jgi:hypothetical protein
VSQRLRPQKNTNKKLVQYVLLISFIYADPVLFPEVMVYSLVLKMFHCLKMECRKGIFTHFVRFKKITLKNEKQLFKENNDKIMIGDHTKFEHGTMLR